LINQTPIGQKKVNDEFRREYEKGSGVLESDSEKAHKDLGASKLNDIQAVAEKWEKTRKDYSPKSRDWTFADRILKELTDLLAQ
ncbi:MAG: hypothetical protein SAJ37_18475, partial [Oscillatoria sp. PMC 1068.18]|nr:hypothetical protein [Oscillatoria sp. PMC 1068.18]